MSLLTVCRPITFSWHRKSSKSFKKSENKKGDRILPVEHHFRMEKNQIVYYYIINMI